MDDTDDEDNNILPSLPRSEQPLPSDMIIQLLRHSSGDICRPFCVIADADSSLTIMIRNIDQSLLLIRNFRYTQRDQQIETDLSTFECTTINDVRRRAIGAIRPNTRLVLCPSAYYALLIHRSIDSGPRMGYGLQGPLPLRKVYEYTCKHARKHLLFPIRYLIEHKTEENNIEVLKACMLRMALFLSWLLGDPAPLDHIMNITQTQNMVRMEDAVDLIDKLQRVFAHLHVSDVPP